VEKEGGEEKSSTKDKEDRSLGAEPKKKKWGGGTDQRGKEKGGKTLLSQNSSESSGHSGGRGGDKIKKQNGSTEAGAEERYPRIGRDSPPVGKLQEKLGDLPPTSKKLRERKGEGRGKEKQRLKKKEGIDATSHPDAKLISGTGERGIIIIHKVWKHH